MTKAPTRDDMNYEEIAEAVRGLKEKSKDWLDRIHVESIGDPIKGGRIVVIIPKEDLEVLQLAAIAFTKIVEGSAPADWFPETDEETKIDA